MLWLWQDIDLWQLCFLHRQKWRSQEHEVSVFNYSYQNLNLQIPGSYNIFCSVGPVPCGFVGLFWIKMGPHVVSRFRCSEFWPYLDSPATRRKTTGATSQNFHFGRSLVEDLNTRNLVAIPFLRGPKPIYIYIYYIYILYIYIIYMQLRFLGSDVKNMAWPLHKDDTHNMCTTWRYCQHGSRKSALADGQLRSRVSWPPKPACD